MPEAARRDRGAGPAARGGGWWAAQPRPPLLKGLCCALLRPSLRAAPSWVPGRRQAVREPQRAAGAPLQGGLCWWWIPFRRLSCWPVPRATRFGGLRGTGFFLWRGAAARGFLARAPWSGAAVIARPSRGAGSSPFSVVPLVAVHGLGWFHAAARFFRAVARGGAADAQEKTPLRLGPDPEHARTGRPAQSFSFFSFFWATDGRWVRVRGCRGGWCALDTALTRAYAVSAQRGVVVGLVPPVVPPMAPPVVAPEEGLRGPTGWCSWTRAVVPRPGAQGRRRARRSTMCRPRVRARPDAAVGRRGRERVPRIRGAVS
ncbi:hypothetical protein K377_07997 [Streptomyces sp. PsTaAH-137]|nr:hypothetical protein K377_07997 [Streptomyces sp. PsTaAH-137]